MEYFRGQSKVVSLDEPYRLAEAEQMDGEWRHGVEQKNESIDRAAIHGLMISQIRTLTEEEQLIVTLRYVEDLQWEAVALNVGKSIIAVRVAHHRIIKKLRKKIEKEKNI